MAIPTPVNGQITDAVTQSNLTVVGQAPAMALGNLLQVSAQAFGLMMQNAAAAQQQLNITAQAVTTQGAVVLSSSASASAAKLAQSDVPDNLLSLLAALRAGTGPIPS
ncbi:MAG: RebB family R body protein [Rhizomicrobium sp.]